jgi:2-polyprenyl-3-methyl-5-hydroxy-6-metoxy-1,4-benzoquinol methylase
MKPKSPITYSDNVIVEKEIPSSFLIEQYKKDLNIDTGRFFTSLHKIKLYRCKDTGYCFYWPFEIAGDDKFYQELEKFPWYYMDGKWEHGKAVEFINKDDRVLEIGCGRGSFLKTIREKGAIVEGLEMNTKAVRTCLNNDLSVSADTIQKFSTGRKNTYNVVCFFQVMEHVPDIKNFLESSLAVLKPGGLMIASVPNNDSLIFKTDNISSNMPPHHLGLWNINSLIKLQNYFNIRVESIYIEPLQEYHSGFAKKIAYKTVMEKLRSKLGFSSRLLSPIAKRFALTGVMAVREFIIGHTVLAVFRKNYAE